jgi:hypothetical protein
MLTQENIMVWIAFFIMFFTLCVMQWNNKLPSVHAIRILLTTINSKGANILTLALMTIFFFVMGMRFIYWTVEKMIDGRLTSDNAIVAQGFNWISGAAFGMVLSAMLKAMTGDGGQNRSTDVVTPGTTVTSTTSSTTKTDVNGTISHEIANEAANSTLTQATTGTGTV